MAKAGDLVIFGEVDAPQAQCVGRIVRRDGEVWHGKYLSRRTLDRYKGPLCDSVVTPLSDFGVRASFAGNLMTIERVGPSIATYSDHKKRDWQERLPLTIEVQ